MGYRFQFVFLFSFATFSSLFATITRDSLGYQFGAHDAADRVFQAKLELGAAKSAHAKAKDIYERQSQLVKSGAGSSFEFSNAAIAFIRAKFKIIEWGTVMKDAETQIKINNINQIAEEANKPSDLVELASLYVNLRTARLAVTKSLVEDSKSLLDEVSFQFKRIEQLVQLGSISTEEYITAKVDYHTALQLVKDAEDHVKIVEVQLADAKRSLESAQNERLKK